MSTTIIVAAWLVAATLIALWWGRTARAGTAHLEKPMTDEMEDRS